MLAYLLTALLILTCLFAYKCIIKPKRELDSYARHFESKGFKVYKIPFKPLSVPLVDIIMEGQKEGNPLKIIKEIYPNYDVVISNSLSDILIDCVNLDLLKQFFSVENPERYPKIQAFIVPFKRVLGNGLAFSEGANWKQKRKILNKVFTFDFLQGLCGKIAKISDEQIDEILRETKNDNTNEQAEFVLLDLTTKIFSNVIMEGFLGVGIQSEKIQNISAASFLISLLDNINDQVFEILPLILGSKYLKMGVWASHRQINRKLVVYENWCTSTMRRKIQQCEASLDEKKNYDKKPEDLIEAILLDKKKSKDAVYGEKDIIDEFNTFFTAGTDTTSNFVATMIFLIVKDKQVERKVREEIQKFMKTDDFSYENLKNLQYIEWVQKQTMRLGGPAPQIFVRSASYDHYLCGVPIRKGTNIMATQQAHCYSEKYFKDPLAFRPERWENQCNDLSPFILAGFSAGPRSCIGKSLAYLESKIALVKIFKRFSHLALEKENYKMQFRFVYAPEKIKIRAKLSKN